MIKVIIAFIVPLLCLSQTPNTVTIKFSEKDYTSVANDSIRRIYQNQLQLSRNKTLSPETLCLQYKWNQLQVKAIPKFRIRRDATVLFTCNANIESFIQFEEKVKYMSAIIIADNRYQAMVTLPHPYFETERINNYDFRLEVTMSVYEDILESVQVNGKYAQSLQKSIEAREGNFFFGIYGLWDVIFEVDHKTNFLYAFTIGNEASRMPANVYIHKFIGIDKIRLLAQGHYEDIDGLQGQKIECGEDLPEKEVYINVLQSSVR